jgi:hypothetical protein
VLKRGKYAEEDFPFFQASITMISFFGITFFAPPFAKTKAAFRLGWTVSQKMSHISPFTFGARINGKFVVFWGTFLAAFAVLITGSNGQSDSDTIRTQYRKFLDEKFELLPFMREPVDFEELKAVFDDSTGGYVNVLFSKVSSLEPNYVSVSCHKVIAKEKPTSSQVRDWKLSTEMDQENFTIEIGMGIQNYESARGHLPAGIVWHSMQGRFRNSSWLFHLLPFLEESARASIGRQDWDTGSQFVFHSGFQSVVPVYQCPSDPRSGVAQWTHRNRLAGLTSYVGVTGTDYTSRDGVLFQDSRIRTADILDGLSQTLLVGERPPSTDHWYGWWYAGTGQMVKGAPSGSPDMVLGARERNDDTSFDASACPPGPYAFQAGSLEQQCSLFHFWSLHSGGGQFTLCDGSVHFISYGVDENLIPAMATRAGQEIISFQN